MRVLSKPKQGVWDIKIVEKTGSIGKPLYKVATLYESYENTGRENWEAFIPSEYFNFKPEEGKRYTVLIELSSNGRKAYTIKEFP